MSSSKHIIYTYILVYLLGLTINIGTWYLIYGIKILNFK